MKLVIEVGLFTAFVYCMHNIMQLISPQQLSGAQMNNNIKTAKTAQKVASV